MILYDFRCSTGHEFEAAVASMSADNPACPACDANTRRLFSRINLGNSASAGHSREEMPRSWQATGGGDRDTIRHWHKHASQREKLEQKYPELAGDRRPVLAHEGRFHDKPLRAGDNPGDWT
ncbi:FmdB family zinc ribbon protein [Enemella evansiae]|uniref:FmdB family zinc ribbon protein n=1 Tax=Enemella evansiae TaxID=2016499 RepID=UPI000B97278B|nr:zinc ribbon domain-containing protein [Enemella evansiae]OYO06329.1 transcriptional regulator [Enemella evansiae]